MNARASNDPVAYLMPETQSMPAPYNARREVDYVAGLLQRLAEGKAREAQNYATGFARGRREAVLTVAKHGGVLVTVGVCIGIALAVVCLPTIAGWLL